MHEDIYICLVYARVSGECLRVVCACVCVCESVRDASVLSVDHRIKQDTVIATLGHEVQRVEWGLQCPVFGVEKHFEGPRIWQGIGILDNLSTHHRQKDITFWWSFNQIQLCVCVCVCICVCECMRCMHMCVRIVV